MEMNHKRSSPPWVLGPWCASLRCGYRDHSLVLCEVHNFDSAFWKTRIFREARAPRRTPSRLICLISGAVSPEYRDRASFGLNFPSRTIGGFDCDGEATPGLLRQPTMPHPGRRPRKSFKLALSASVASCTRLIFQSIWAATGS